MIESRSHSKDSNHDKQKVIIVPKDKPVQILDTKIEEVNLEEKIRGRNTTLSKREKRDKTSTRSKDRKHDRKMSDSESEKKKDSLKILKDKKKHVKDEKELEKGEIRQDCSSSSELLQKQKIMEIEQPIEKDKNKEKEQVKDKDQEKQKEKEKKQDKDKEKEKEKGKEKEKEKEKEKKKDKDKIKEKEKDKEKAKIEQEKQKEKSKDKENNKDGSKRSSQIETQREFTEKKSTHKEKERISVEKGKEEDKNRDKKQGEKKQINTEKDKSKDQNLGKSLNKDNEKNNKNDNNKKEKSQEKTGQGKDSVKVKKLEKKDKDKKRGKQDEKEQKLKSKERNEKDKLKNETRSEKGKGQSQGEDEEIYGQQNEGGIRTQVKKGKKVIQFKLFVFRKFCGQWYCLIIINIFDSTSRKHKKQKKERQRQRQKQDIVDRSRSPFKESQKHSSPVKMKPNFESTGILAQFAANNVGGTVLRFTEPLDAQIPPSHQKWKLFPFNGDDALPTIYLRGQSCFLIGRDMNVADIPLTNPSISAQHAVIQFRQRRRPDDPMAPPIVKPYILDLETTNGSFINGKKVEGARYYELIDKDVLRFGASQRDYVLMLDESKE